MVSERMNNEVFVKQVYLSETEGSNRRGRPLGRWKGRVKKWMDERRTGKWGGFELNKEEMSEQEEVEALLLLLSLWGHHLVGAWHHRLYTGRQMK